MNSVGFTHRSLQLTATTLLAFATALLSASGVSAEDPSWDIGAYDDCIGREIDDQTDKYGWYDINWTIDVCCRESGGVVTGSLDAPDCVAPPADPAGRSPGAPGGPGAGPKPGAGAPPQVSDPGLAPPATPSTTPLIAPAPAPGMAPS